MSSGFIEIAALGQQDVHLTGSPDVTYFSSLYKRHTPFVLEAFEVPFKASSISMGQNNVVLIPPKGDLIRATTLKLSLPPLATYGQDWFWPEKPNEIRPVIIIDSVQYQPILPVAGQYYSSNTLSFNNWISGIPGVTYDPILNKFVITATTGVAVYAPTDHLVQSGVFWGFDPKNPTSKFGDLLIYKAVNGQVVPDFTLEQAGWSRTIGDPINTNSGLFLTLNQTFVNPTYLNFNDKNITWTSQNAPTAYTITPGGRISFSQIGNYIFRISALGDGAQVLFGSDTSDGAPPYPNSYLPFDASTDTNSVFWGTFNVTDLSQNYYVVLGSVITINPGTYVSIEPIDDYFEGSGGAIISGHTYPITTGATHHGAQVTSYSQDTFSFNHIGQWIINGVISTNTIFFSPMTLITSIQLRDSANLLYTYDVSERLAYRTEFSIPVTVTFTGEEYSIIVNVINSQSINPSYSFVAMKYFGLPNGGTPLYPTGGYILPMNGLYFNLGNKAVTSPIALGPVGEYGVENMISVTSNTVTFNNVGTYMMTTYFPIAVPNSNSFITSHASDPYVDVDNNGLTVNAHDFISEADNIPTVLLRPTFGPNTKYMFSVTIDNRDVTDNHETTAVGLAGTTMNLTNNLGYDSNSIGYYNTGFLASATQRLASDPFTTGSIVDVAVDTTSNKMMWIRVDGGGWSDLTQTNTGDPTIGYRGFDISYITNIATAGYKFGVNVYTTGKTTINSTSLYSVPAGYTFAPGTWYVKPPSPTSDSLWFSEHLPNPYEWPNQTVTVDSSSNVYIIDQTGPTIGGGIIRNLTTDSVYAGGKDVGSSVPATSARGTSIAFPYIQGIVTDSDDTMYVSLSDAWFGTDTASTCIQRLYPGGFLRDTVVTITRYQTYYMSVNNNYIYLLATQGAIEGQSIVYQIDKATGTDKRLDKYDDNFRTEPIDIWTDYWTSVAADNTNVYLSKGGGLFILVNTIGPLTSLGNLNSYPLDGPNPTFNNPGHINVYDSNLKIIIITDTIADTGQNTTIRIIDCSNNLVPYAKTLSLSGGFTENPLDPLIINAGSIFQNLASFSYSNGYIYYTLYKEDYIDPTVYRIDVSTGITTHFNTNTTVITSSYFRLTYGPHVVTTPIQVTSAPMSYPIRIGNVGSTFGAGAYVSFYPLTSGSLPFDSTLYHYYDSVGTWAIKTADLKIGGQTIQSLTGEYIEIWNDLNVSYENQPALKLLTGKYDTTIASGRDYYVNLPFYFYEKSQNYLPICSLGRQDVEIWVTFRTLQALTAIPVSPNPVQATLIVEYVYLAAPELNWFTKTKLQYVIEQAQYQTFNLDAGFTQGIFPVLFENPVAAIFFVFQVDGSVPYDYSYDGVYRMGITFNGEEIMTNRITDTTQIGILEPFNNFITFPSRNFYMKTFESPINFSRIRQAAIELNIQRSDSYYPAKKFRITAVNYNVLQIADGLGGLMFISQ